MSSILIRSTAGLVLALTATTAMAQAGSTTDASADAPVVIRVEVSRDEDRAERRRRQLALMMLQMAHGDAARSGDLRHQGLAKMIDGLEAREKWSSANRTTLRNGGREIHVMLPANCRARGPAPEPKEVRPGTSTLVVRRGARY